MQRGIVTRSARSLWPTLSYDRVLLGTIALACMGPGRFLFLSSLHGFEINEDGAQYLRAAENLRDGHGYVARGAARSPFSRRCTRF